MLYDWKYDSPTVYTMFASPRRHDKKSSQAKTETMMEKEALQAKVLERRLWLCKISDATFQTVNKCFQMLSSFGSESL